MNADPEFAQYAQGHVTWAVVEIRKGRPPALVKFDIRVRSRASATW